MHKHKEAQEGRVELNIGGHRFETSVQTLRRVSHTFFDAYLSGRYAQDVCEDGSIFVDRDGEHFSHVLQYMRDGVVSVAEAGASPSVSLLRALEREFGFYCIELVVDQPMEPEQPEVAYVVGGIGPDGRRQSSMERYDASSGQWSAVAAMSTACYQFGTCVLAGELYMSGGRGDGIDAFSSVEKYTQHAWVVEEGARLRAALPAYLVPRRALLDAHCPLIPPLLALVRGYDPEPTTTEELWATGLGVAPQRARRLRPEVAVALPVRRSARLRQRLE
jgi:hypothetical protein